MWAEGLRFVCTDFWIYMVHPNVCSGTKNEFGMAHTFLIISISLLLGNSSYIYTCSQISVILCKTVIS